MKGSPRSMWLSAANRMTSWWMGHAANELRRQQRAAVTAMTKTATATKPKRKTRAKRKPG